MGEGFRADTFDVIEFVDGTERAVLGAVIEDALGERGADTGEEFELGLGGGVDVDGAGERGGLRGRLGRRRRD